MDIRISNITSASLRTKHSKRDRIKKGHGKKSHIIIKVPRISAQITQYIATVTLKYHQGRVDISKRSIGESISLKIGTLLAIVGKL